jgi:4-oxalocrotonate tautomerase
MPFIQVTMLEGRSVEQKHELMRRLSEVTAEVVGGDVERIRVALYEVSRDEWAVGPCAVRRVSAQRGVAERGRGARRLRHVPRTPVALCPQERATPRPA